MKLVALSKALVSFIILSIVCCVRSEDIGATEFLRNGPKSLEAFADTFDNWLIVEADFIDSVPDTCSYKCNATSPTCVGEYTCDIGKQKCIKNSYITEVGGSCGGAVQCGPSMSCYEGTCQFNEASCGCNENVTCTSGFQCVNGTCLEMDLYQGEACENDVQCVTGICSSDEGVCSGKEDGADCNIDSDCLFPKICNEGKCHTGKIKGEACDETDLCQADMICQDSKCAISFSKNNGQTCVESKECKSGLCTGPTSNSTGQCVMAHKLPGESCTFDVECAFLKCAAPGICIDPFTRKETQTCEWELDCEPHLHCNAAGVCENRNAWPCTSHDDCSQSGINGAMFCGCDGDVQPRCFPKEVPVVRRKDVLEEYAKCRREFIENLYGRNDCWQDLTFPSVRSPAAKQQCSNFVRDYECCTFFAVEDYVDAYEIPVFAKRRIGKICEAENFELSHHLWLFETDKACCYGDSREESCPFYESYTYSLFITLFIFFVFTTMILIWLAATKANM